MLFSNGHDKVTLCILVTVFLRVTFLLGAGGGKLTGFFCLKKDDCGLVNC